jgi:KaiC/GvpD/RAD55 family RecA-like ATPase
MKFTTFNNKESKHGNGEITYNELCDIANLPGGYSGKDKLPAFMPYTLGDNPRKGFKTESYNAVVLDYDGGSFGFNDVYELNKKLNLSCLIYTSASNKVEKNGLSRERFRIIYPLSEPIDTNTRDLIAGKINAHLKGELGSDSFDDRIYFYERVNGVKYDCLDLSGVNIDDWLNMEFPGSGIDPIIIERKQAHTRIVNSEETIEDGSFESLVNDKLIPISEIDTVESALKHLALCGYADDYNKAAPIGLALSWSAGLGHELWVDFCQYSLLYCRKWADEKWYGFKDAETGYKAILALAAKNGWENPAIKFEDFAPGKVKYRIDFSKYDDDEPFIYKTPLIASWIPKNSIGVIYGDPGSGKSYVALSMAYSLAKGENWLGYAVTKPRNVVYFGLEGGQENELRLRALINANGKFDKDTVNFILETSPFDITKIESAERYLSTIAFIPDVIFLDTLSAAFAGDENDSTEMKKVNATMAALQNKGITVILIHHKGKDGKMRGSTALFGALDWTIEVAMDKNTKIININSRKMRLYVETEKDGIECSIATTKMQLVNDETGEINVKDVGYIRKEYRDFEDEPPPKTGNDFDPKSDNIFESMIKNRAEITEFNTNSSHLNEAIRVSGFDYIDPVGFLVVKNNDDGWELAIKNIRKSCRDFLKIKDSEKLLSDYENSRLRKNPDKFLGWLKNGDIDHLTCYKNSEFIYIFLH